MQRVRSYIVPCVVLLAASLCGRQAAGSEALFTIKFQRITAGGPIAIRHGADTYSMSFSSVITTFYSLGESRFQVQNGAGWTDVICTMSNTVEGGFSCSIIVDGTVAVAQVFPQGSLTGGSTYTTTNWRVDLGIQTILSGGGDGGGTPAGELPAGNPEGTPAPDAPAPSFTIPSAGVGSAGDLTASPLTFGVWTLHKGSLTTSRNDQWGHYAGGLTTENAWIPSAGWWTTSPLKTFLDTVLHFFCTLAAFRMNYRELKRL